MFQTILKMIFLKKEINNFFLENINYLYIEENISKKFKFINK